MDTNTSLKGLVEADMQDVVDEVVEHKAKPKEVVQKKDLVGAAVVEWVDSTRLTFVRSGQQGFEEMKLEAGHFLLPPGKRRDCFSIPIIGASF